MDSSGGDARRGTRLAASSGVDHLDEHARTPLVQIDPERRAIELRIEAAKRRLAADIDRASALVRRAASGARRGLVRAAVMGGLLLLGVAAALIRRRRRLRVVWK